MMFSPFYILSVPLTQRNRLTIFITKYFIHSCISHNNLSFPFKHIVLSFTSNIEPWNYTEASKHPQWVKVMTEELNALNDNHT